MKRPRTARRHRTHGTGETAVHALRGVDLGVAARRAGRRHGPVRLRQVDPAQPGRRAGLAERGRGLVEGEVLGTSTRKAGPHAAPPVGYVFQDLNLLPA